MSMTCANLDRMASSRRLLVKSPSRAFTLIEVLVAMVLMAIIMPALMRGISVTGKAAAQAKNLAESAALADKVLNELLVKGVTDQQMESNQPFDFWPEVYYSYQAYSATDK